MAQEHIGPRALMHIWHTGMAGQVCTMVLWCSHVVRVFVHLGLPRKMVNGVAMTVLPVGLDVT